MMRRPACGPLLGVQIAQFYSKIMLLHGESAEQFLKI